MREIKFRAWDNVNKIMVFFEGLDINQEYSCISFILAGFGNKKTNWETLENTQIPGEYTATSPDNKPEQYDLMQYTGLKDKNGVKIYEGDIVQWTLNSRGDIARAEMKYAIDQLGGGYFTTPHINCDSEVIGNIYENPELLERK